VGRSVKRHPLGDGAWRHRRPRSDVGDRGPPRHRSTA